MQNCKGYTASVSLDTITYSTIISQENLQEKAFTTLRLTMKTCFIYIAILVTGKYILNYYTEGAIHHGDRQYMKY